MEAQGTIKFKQIGNTLVVSASDLLLKGAISSTEDFTVIATGFPRKQSQAFLLHREDGFSLRVRVNEKGELTMHYPMTTKASRYQFYCSAAV